jgi:predicted PolB exonuclease-like 3'-5' exonuclease
VLQVIFRVLDLETVADYSCWTRGDPRYQVVPSPRCVHPDGSPHVTLQELDVVPPPHACRVVAASVVDVCFHLEHEPRYWFSSCWTDCRWSADPVEADVAEATLLRAFTHAMEQAHTDVHLVTWNGRGFDLPVIVMRSLKHKIAVPWYYKNKEVRYRYSAEGHYDLMDFLGDFGATRFMRLGDVARLCGLPGKTDTKGSDVASLYAGALADPSQDEAIRARVARYCLQDTLQTALIFLRAHHLRGKIQAETHDACLDTFRASPEVAAALDIDWSRVRVGEVPQQELPGVLA